MSAPSFARSGDPLDDLQDVAEIAAGCGFNIALLADEGQPVVLRGLVADWPAVAAGRSPQGLSAYLKAMDNGATAPVMEAPAKAKGRFGYAGDLREFSFTKRQRGLSETLDRIDALSTAADAPCVAIQMLPLATALPAFVRDNAMLLLPDVAPLLWLGGPVRTQIHNDRDHNLACVVAGHRRFLLFPPEQVANLYIGPLDNPPPLSLVDPEQPDLGRFPRFAEALSAASGAMLAPGDALLIPRYWWHHVASLEPYNAMVNYWWGQRPGGLDSPNDCFLSALLALKDLPHGERSYWRAMFEAYVFANDGEATAHIPAALQGALGTMRPSARAALKQRLKTEIARHD